MFFGFRQLLASAGCCLLPWSSLACTTQSEVDPRQPAGYRIAVAPLDFPQGWAPARHGLRLAIQDDGALDAELIASLRAAGVATEIIPVASEKSKEARAADLILKPHLVDAKFTSKGSNSGAFLSNALWFTTWAGSFPVHDQTYDANFRLRYDVYGASAYAGSISHETKTRSIDLAYWDRNDLFPWGLVQSLFLFPILSIDCDEPTSRSLTRLAFGIAAKDLKDFLNDDYPVIAEQQCAWVHISSPVNSAMVQGSVRVGFEVISSREINEIRLFVDDQTRARCAWISTSMGLTSIDSDETRTLSTRATGGNEWRTEDEVADVALSPGVHFIRIQAVCGALESSSTVTVQIEAKH